MYQRELFAVVRMGIDIRGLPWVAQRVCPMPQLPVNGFLC